MKASDTGQGDHREQRGPETTVPEAGRALWSILSLLEVQASQRSQVLKGNLELYEKSVKHWESQSKLVWVDMAPSPWAGRLRPAPREYKSRNYFIDKKQGRDSNGALKPKFIEFQVIQMNLPAGLLLKVSH